MAELNEELKVKTRKCYTKIAESFDPKGYVIGKLFEEKIITSRELKEINGFPDKETRAQEILSHLFQTSHTQAFVVFREALQKDYGWIVDLVYGIDPSGSRPVTQRSSEGLEVDIDPTLKKSKQSQSSVSEVNHSTSANDPPEQVPCPPEQRSVILDSDNILSSGVANAKQHAPTINADKQQPGSKRTTGIPDQDNDGINLENPTSTDIEKYNKGFADVLGELEGYIDPFNKLPFHFQKYEIMTFEEAEKIERSKPQKTLEIVAKMNEYLKKDPQNCLLLLKALIENDQTHIAKFIVSSGKNTRSPDRVLHNEEKDAIDQNMFCLERLVSPRVNDFLVMLVSRKCITANHKEWILSYKTENKDVYQLFEILKRRSFKHFSDFNSCLEGIGQKRIVDVLRTGGVVEIMNHLKGIESRPDLETIEKGIIAQLCGCLDRQHDNPLNKEQQTFIDKLIALLNDHQIKFIACYPTHSISLYFQCETQVSQEWLVDFCENGEFKEDLKTLFRALQPELDSYSNFDIDVCKGHSSKIHSIETKICDNSGSSGAAVKGAAKNDPVKSPPPGSSDAAKKGAAKNDPVKSPPPGSSDAAKKGAAKNDPVKSPPPGSSGAAVQGAAKNDQVKSPPPDAPLARMTESNEELKIKTRNVFAKIKASLDPKGYVVDTLFQEGVITTREHKEITNGPDKETRADCLLSHVFETPHPRAFVVFREALKKDYGWVVEFIDKGQ